VDAVDAIARSCARRVASRYLAGLARYGADFDDSEIRADVAMAMDPGEKRMGPVYRKFARQSADRTMREVREVLLREVLRNPKARLSDVRESLRRVGITGDSDDDVVRTLVRTQHSIGRNARTWIDTIDDPRVWGYAYRTAEDERVRPAHAAMDGKRYPKRHPFWRRYAPPNGWNCRCELVPVYRGTRLARTLAYRGRPDVDEDFLWNPGIVLAG
jgi:SPP1 gp7 family putative phage head morphogenesis protein